MRFCLVPTLRASVLVFSAAACVLVACGSSGEPNGSGGQGQRPGPSKDAPGPRPTRPASRKADEDPSRSGQPGAAASQITVRGASAEPGAPFYAPRVETLESSPVRFALELTRDLPMAGGRIEVEDVRVDAESKRIVARILQLPPPGPSAAVITPAQVRLELGALAPGRYVLELELRDGRAGKYERLQSLRITAK